MAKRVRRISKSNYSSKHKEEEEDWISELPDDILGSILSLLTLKEAAGTSVLSRRWRYLWASFTDLKFDATETLNKIDEIDEKPALFNKERRHYINWVNRVVRQHRGPTLDQFRIRFDLDRSYKRVIDRWIKFAISKRVQRLELNLSEEHGFFYRPKKRNYALLYNLLLDRRRGSHSSSNMPSSPCTTFVGFMSLKALLLKSVNVSGEFLEYFLSNCPVLEQLSVHGSAHLVNLRVSGSSLRLKHLEIILCVGVKTIDICDSNLISLNYFGAKINLLLKNVPLLVEVSMCQGFFRSENYVFSQLSCCLSQLEILTLEIGCLEERIEFYVFPKLTKLKQLVLKVGAWGDQSLIEIASLTRFCPYLQKFVLKVDPSSA